VSGTAARKPAAQGIQGRAASRFLREEGRVPPLKVTEMLIREEK